MIQGIAPALGLGSRGPVFVVGTGRSGTHWLGESLGEHPEVRATIEVSPMYSLGQRMALDATREATLFPVLAAAYRWQLLKSDGRVYLDKTHTAIWLAEKLKRVFPSARFVGTRRDPYATVASMIQHPKVRAWHERWREFRVPNRFLGITEELAETYDDLSLATQCAIRWKTHEDRMAELERTLGDDLMVITYEDFADDPQATVAELQRFLGLDQPIPVPEVKRDSLDKWRHNLDRQQIADIEAVVGFKPGEG